ncbi:MAG: uracil-DNA glycosylase, partial [Planctomycetota bacterium]|nr:uracil-DNA glycosylase [Planctomycetota bacterium]
QYMTNERSIMRSRGRWFEYNGIPMMATYHPAFLLRNENEKRNCWEDMKQVKARIDVLNSGGE